MSDSENADNTRSSRVLEVRVAARLENLAVLRTVIGAVGTFEDLDLDAVADLRLAVDEACTRLIRSADSEAQLILVIDPRPNEVVVDVATTALTVEVGDILTPGSFSWHVLTSLTDDVRTFHDGAELHGVGPIFGISMTTRRVSPAR
jgi:serine/threonine-protein kinase RsbW